MSSGFSQAVLTLLVVGVGGAALDYHVITTHHPHGTVAAEKDVTPFLAADSGRQLVTGIAPNIVVGGGEPRVPHVIVAPAANPPARPGGADAIGAPPIRALSLAQMLHASKPDPAVVASAEARALDARQLRVCSDPNNLPFSNKQGEGFENALADLVARDLGLRVAYTWLPQRRGFIRNTLDAGTCDLVMGVPSSSDMVLPTTAYYRSSYVFVTRRDRNLRILSFDDARLRGMRIGLHAVGNDYGTVPPARELAARGLVSNIRGYSIYGSYSRPNPPKDLIDAVANGEVDVAIAWGPLAGYFAQREPAELRVTPVTTAPQSQQAASPATTPMSFDISMGVRRGDDALRARLEAVLSHRRADIHRLLAHYGVPLTDGGTVPRTGGGRVPLAQGGGVPRAQGGTVPLPENGRPPLTDRGRTMRLAGNSE